MLGGAFMRLSIFSVLDHYPERHRSLGQLYKQVIAQGVLAEQLGYDTYLAAEHHFHEYGAAPNPVALLSLLAGRTTRIRLGPAIAVLPFRSPVEVAESYGMVDVLSGGRLLLGVGSGYLKHEFEGFGVDPAEKRDRFDEALGLVTRLMSGERVTYDGRFHRLDGVRLNALPLQQPSPPIYVAVLRKEAAYHVGRKGQNLLSVPYASVEDFAEIGDLIGEFRKGRAEAGLPPGDDAIIALHGHVAASDAEARENAAEAFDLYVATRLYAKRQTYDDIMTSGLGLFGSVQTVAAKLAQLQDWGIDHVALLMDFGLLAARPGHPLDDPHGRTGAARHPNFVADGRNVDIVDPEPRRRTMRVRISKWGNSLALRLPHAAAASLDVHEGQSVELTIQGDHLEIRSARPRYRLQDLLDQIDPDHVPAPIDVAPVGEELL